MGEHGIASVGTYVPRFRIDAAEYEEAAGGFKASGIRETAVPDVDEDALTMGYEAGRAALAAGGVAGSAIDALWVVSTTPPVREADIAVELGEMLGVPNTSSRTCYSGSACDGLQGILDAFRAASRGRSALVVVSDCPVGHHDEAFEHAAGAGAAAFVLAPEGIGSVRETAEYSESYPGTRFLPRGEKHVRGLGISGYDRKAFETSVARVLDQVAFDPDDADAVCMQVPTGVTVAKGASALGLDIDTVRRHAIRRRFGDVGSACVPLSIADALASGRETLLAVGFGGEAKSIVSVIDLDGEVPVERVLPDPVALTYAEYVRIRGHLDAREPSGGGAYVSVPSWKRTQRQRYRREAGRCTSCGTLTVRPRGACQSCGHLVEYTPVTLSHTGEVEAVTEISDGGAPPEFAQYVSRSGNYQTVIAAFDGSDGGSASVPAMVVNANDDGLSVGDTVRATIRRIYTQEGVTRYGLKVAPVT